MIRLTFFVLLLLVISSASPTARGEITATQVKESIETGCKYLEGQQHPDGHWTDHPGEPGGLTALCTLALLNSGRTKDDTHVKKALDYLNGLSNPERTYSVSLIIMA